LKWQLLRRLVLGERLATARAEHERLPKFLALPIFASDAISSSAYATEEILLALVLAGSLALHYATAISVAICLLFAIVAISYRQTIIAYPSGGGAYIVARENLGIFPGVLAASALLTDYVLTVAVSIAAGVAAILSAMPELMPYRIILCLLLIAFIALANLRGVRESGWLFAGPTYLFIISGLLLLGVGAYRALTGAAPDASTPPPLIAATHPLTIFILLRAFASGCAALTGTEAISNAVQAFKAPEAKNAAATLLLMAFVCILLFLGITMLTQTFHILPDGAFPGGMQHHTETVLSKLGRAVFGVGPLYYLLQIATAMILVLAANTSFAGFPRLASILAADNLAPRQLANLGDRLVFSNGIVLLGLVSGGLIVLFHGLTHALIPLYAVGVFLAFTLSQAGMVVHWRKEKTPGWQIKAAVNAVGAASTFVVLLIVGGVKFMGGAWIVLLLIPLLVLVFYKISQHYQILSRTLTIEGYSAPRALRHVVIVLVPGLHRGVLDAIAYAKSISSECEGVYVEIDPIQSQKLREEWKARQIDMPLTVLQSPWRSLTEPIIQYIKTVRVEQHADLVTVVLPEYVTTRWWHRLLHNQAGLMLKWALMFVPGVVVTNVRYHTNE
jgi:amino acid transporter